MKHSCVSCLIQPRPQFLLHQTQNPLESCVHYTKWPISKINWHQQGENKRIPSGGVSPLSDLCRAFRKVQIPKTLKRNETAIPIFGQVVNTTFTLQTVFLDKALSDFLLRFSFGSAERLHLLTHFRLLILNFSPKWRAADVRCIF